jgi:integrase
MTNLVNTLNMLKNGDSQENHEALKNYINREFPSLMKALQIIDSNYSKPKQRKGFNLVKRENKKNGFLFYVRYSHEGKMLPSKWNTHTKIREEAERFARDNRDRLVDRYLREHNKRGFELFERFYEKDSKFLACEEKRNRPLSDTTRRNYHSVITERFVPFMKSRHIKCYENAGVKEISDFQDYYLAEGIKPQTVNDYLKAVRRIYTYLIRKGHINENPCLNLRNIPVSQRDKKERGCYELKKIKGVFEKKWSDRKLYLLCLLIYTTGMRNCEIGKIRMKDIINIEGCRFVDIKESKTENGVRLAPLHERVYRKLKEYAAGKSFEEQVFTNCTSTTFAKANHELARILKMGETAEEQNITFYSGRHFWKTLMNSQGLGEEVEEIFMGHKVSNDVAKLYNHRDKQGKKHMVKKAKQVFFILERQLFSRPVKRPRMNAGTQ